MTKNKYYTKKTVAATTIEEAPALPEEKPSAPFGLNEYIEPVLPNENELSKTSSAKTELSERYDWLRCPVGMFDFQTAGLLFRSESSVSNKKTIEQYRELLGAGYIIKQFVIDQGYVYLLFEKL